MAFYKTQVRTACERCKKQPRKLYEIKTSGSSPSWGRFCGPCADKRIRELSDTHRGRDPYAY